MTSIADDWKYQFEIDFDNINPNFNCSPYFDKLARENEAKHGKPTFGALTIEVALFLIILICSLYLPVLYLVWRYREK